MSGDNISGADSKLTQEIQKMMKSSGNEAVEDLNKLVTWRIEGQDKKLKVNAQANLSNIDVSTVSQVSAKRVKAPGEVTLLGYKINISEKLESFKDDYVKNYIQTKSHNYLLSKFALLKVAFLGQMLSMLGVTSEDIKKLQKQAMESAIDENMNLFKENEYNSELIEIVGGPKRQVKAQKKAIGEIRRQLTTQAVNLGLGHYYTQRKILEIQLDQSRAILDNFREEKDHLAYQLEYMA